MIRKWYGVYRYRYTSTRSGMEIKNELGTLACNSEEPYEYRVDGPLGLWVTRYRWTVSVPDDANYYRIEEQTWISREGVLFFGFVAFPLFLVHDLVTAIEILSSSLGVLIGLLGVASMCLYNQFPDPKASPLTEIFDEENEPLTLLYAPVGIVIVVAASASLLIDAPLTLLVAVALIGYSALSERLSPILMNGIDALAWTVRRLPSVCTVYLAIFLMVFLTVYSYATLLGDITAVRTAQYLPALSLGTSMGQTALAIMLYGSAYYLLLDANHSRREFIERGRTTDNPILLLSFGTFVVAASVLLWLVAITWLETAIWLHSNTVRPWMVLATAATGIGIAYYIVGAAYQWTRLATLLWTYERAATTDHDLDTSSFDAEIRLLETDTVTVGAASNGFRDYIIVTSGLVDVLEEDELETVLAHEEGHLERGDATIGFVVALLSPLLLVGKNVFYSLFDFREREFAADRYAVERTDPETLERTLRKLRGYELQQRMGAQANVLPSMTSSESTGRVEKTFERLFGYFYGSFALTDVHPEIQERIDKFESV